MSDVGPYGNRLMDPPYLCGGASSMVSFVFAVLF